MPLLQTFGHNVSTLMLKNNTNIINGVEAKCHKQIKNLQAEIDACFYEYFIPNCRAYLTSNINLNANLANGTLMREHASAFNSIDEP
jgi:hypothetical protein